MTLYEVDQAANEIRAEVDPNANIILGSTFDESLEGRMRVAVVSTGIDDDAIVAQHTVVEPARRASDAMPRRPAVHPRPVAPREPEPARPVYDEPRPSFANDLEPEHEPRRSGGGFSLFGWRKPEPRDEPPLAEINLDEGFGELEDDPLARNERVRDPALDEELEIPAFLRRQMTPR
jgi:cell division protein FtsZ